MVMKTKMVVIFYFVIVLSFFHFPANEGRSIPDDKSFFSEAPHFKNGIHCPKPLDRNDASSSCDTSAVHVATTIDRGYMRGTIALVHSILTHASCPESIFFHFVFSDHSSSDSRAFARTLESTFPSLSFKLYAFKDSIVADLISSSIREALDTPLNYARSYLAELLGDCVERVIYLDSDTLVIDDIAKLWRVRLTGSRTVAAPEYCEADFEKYFTGEFWSDGELRRVFAGRKKRPCYFNTGVMVMDLARWRERGFTAEIERWMRVQKERKRIYELGSLPPFLLVFAGDIEPIDHRWNQHGLGGDNVVDSCRSLHPGPVSLLHWSGKGKPWVRLHSGQPCPVDLSWAPYDLYIQ